MKITSVQWNIGGGNVLTSSNVDPTRDASYGKDGLSEIASFLRSVDADIITLQEVHSDETRNQAEEIAKELGMNYVASDFYADSHIQEGQRLGHAIISKFPLTEHVFELFVNPKYEVVWEDGSMAISHDKGVTKVHAEIDGRTLEVATTHLTPFRRFGIDPLSNEAEAVIADIQDKLQTTGPTLIQGDFNLDFEALAPVFPKLFAGGLREITQTGSTTPKGRAYDHILFREMKLASSYVEASATTDHYPLVATFEF